MDLRSGEIGRDSAIPKICVMEPCDLSLNAEARMQASILNSPELSACAHAVFLVYIYMVSCTRHKVSHSAIRVMALNS